MIDNKVKGKSFAGCVKYVMNQRNAELIDTNLSGRNKSEMIAEFQLGRHLNPNVKNIVFHASLSAAPGEELSNDKWRDLAQDYLSGMGFDDNQYIVVRHHELEESGKHDHAHIHIIASRVKLTGECVSDSWDYRRSTIVMKELEHTYNLVQTPHHLSYEKERHNPTKGEMQLLYKQQRDFENGRRQSPASPSARMKLQALIDQFTQQPTTISHLIEQLQLVGVEVRIRQTRKGVIQGISFAHPDWQEGIKGSDLGTHYSWSGLQTQKSVSYDPQRDAAAIKNAATASRASTHQKMAVKRENKEVEDGIAGTVTKDGTGTSERIGDADTTSRSSQPDGTSTRTVEPTVSQSAADSLPSDPGKSRLEAAFSQLNHSTNNQRRKLDQLGAAVEQLNADLEPQIERRRRADNGSRTESSAPSTDNQRNRADVNAITAEYQRQLEQLQRLNQQLGKKRREKDIELEEDLAEGFSQSTTTSGRHGTAINPSYEYVELSTTIDELKQLHQDLAAGIKQLGTLIAKQSLTQTPENIPSPKLQFPPTTEERIDYLDSIYQRLANQVKQQTSSRRAEDVDVGVALLGYQEGYSGFDIRLILLRSPKSQYFKPYENAFEPFGSYIEQRKAIALTQKQFLDDPELKKRFDIVKPIVDEFFQRVKEGVERKGTHYILKRLGNTRTVMAASGRGEVLKLTGGWVETCNLTDNDVKVWLQAAEKLKELKRQSQQQSSMRERIQETKKQSNQLELG